MKAAIEAVRDAETALVRELRGAGDRHRADHDVFHMSRTLIRLHEANLEALEPFAERSGAGPAAGGEPAPELDLLGDLRRLYVMYAEASVSWVLLGQGAQAVRDAELLDAVTRCHAQTLRGMKWTLTRLKTAAPQVLAAS